MHAARALAKYRERLSGPFRGRLELTVDVPAVPIDVLTEDDDSQGEASAAVRAEALQFRMTS